MGMAAGCVRWRPSAPQEVDDQHHLVERVGRVDDVEARWEVTHGSWWDGEWRRRGRLLRQRSALWSEADEQRREKAREYEALHGIPFVTRKRSSASGRCVRVRCEPYARQGR